MFGTRKITIFIFFTLTLISCKKENNEKIINTEEFFTSEESISEGINSLYNSLSGLYNFDSTKVNGGGKPAFFYLPGDDITVDGTSNGFENFNGLTANNETFQYVWDKFYAIIKTSNTLIEALNKPEISAVYKTTGLKDVHMAELLFIRSWVNFKLWDNWRKAPLILSKSSLNGKLTPSSEFELLDNAINSLEEAALLGSTKWDQLNKGRITRNSCYGLLVKLYVTRACYQSKNLDDYLKAINAFEKISPEMQSEFLAVKFSDNFDYRTENNAESLFEFNATLGTKPPSSLYLVELIEEFNNSSYLHFYNGHWANYNTGIFGPSEKLIKAFNPEDPRKSETITRSPENNGGAYWWIEKNWQKFDGYHFIKNCNGNKVKLDAMWQINSENNIRILRFADVKLCAAEAYLAKGASSNALQQINDVRERARNSVNPGSSQPGTLSSLTMSDIMNERFLELAGEEGQRWSDLKRWHAAGYINLGTWTASDFGFSYSPALFTFDVNKHLLYPIPEDVLKNNPLMDFGGQNSGY